MKPMIKVESLSKQYCIGTRDAAYETLRESLVGALRAPLQRLRRRRGARRNGGDDSSVWALRDVTFEVAQGETVGIIGRNGAGKSTLLKIISHITEPTSGWVDLYGRVGSLLEVGTGFHPELSGRENIYLNGAILGMRRQEIARKFDEIVAFSEIVQFLDTPVKRYSSGMYMRLAFAVAAYLEPEVLLVDEVLAVGDAQFQKKCLGKMDAVAKEGRTVLFVSHNMTAMRTLCRRIIWLHDGRVKMDGAPGEVISSYLQTMTEATLEQIWDDPHASPGNDKVRLRRVRVSPQGDTEQELTVHTPLELEVEYCNLVPNASLNLSLVLYDLEGTCVFNSISEPRQLPAGLIRGVCHVPGSFLNNRTYRLRVLVVCDTSVVLLDHDNAATFEVHDVAREGNWYGQWVGVVRPEFVWDIELLDSFSDGTTVPPPS